MTPRVTTKTTTKPSPAEARDGPLTLSYALAEVPSSQHRAGLAGLILMVRWLKKQSGERKGTCDVIALDEGGATILIDRDGLGALFDQVYAATQEEQSEASPRKDKGTKAEIPPLRTEERTVTDAKGKEKKKTFYCYGVVIPRGGFLPVWDPAGDGVNGPWVKLWRDMVWSILRGVPATREPFEARAGQRPVRDADELWAELKKGEFRSIELPSTYFLGAQAVTAENVSFRDRVRWQLLLHFWPFVAQVYVPVHIDPHKNQQSFRGYAVTVPDVSRLATFCDELPEVASQRPVEMAGFRPRGSVVDIAAESALDLSSRLADRLRQTEGDKPTSDLLLGIDVFHLEKQGNNVRLLSRSRVEPTPDVIDRYRMIREAYWSPIFRQRRLRNLIAGKRWWDDYDEEFKTWPHELHTIGAKHFRHDCRKAFENEDEVSMSNEAKTDGQRPIARLVYDLVGRYVSRKVKTKAGLDWEKAKGNAEAERSYGDAKEKIARDAFLAIRSRTGADFVDYFASTLCSVPQFIKQDEMVELSRALREQPAEIRTMTLLALSAWS